MTIYNVRVFSNTSLGISNYDPYFTYGISDSTTASTNGENLSILDDDVLLQDSFNDGPGSSLDTSQQILNANIGFGTTGQSVKSITTVFVTNTTTGQSGRGYSIEINNGLGTDTQAFQYYKAFDIAVKQGDALLFTGLRTQGDVLYASLIPGSTFDYFISDAATVTEGGTLAYTITRSGDTANVRSVTFSTNLNGSAISGADYTAPTGVVMFAENSATGTLSIATKTDNIFEYPETVSVILTGASDGGTVSGIGTGTIKDANPGTPDNDTITGTATASTTRLLGGNDIYNGGNGAELVYGNQGNDSLLGGAGMDILYGGQGDDLERGGADADLVYGNLGNDLIYGNQAPDTVYGGQGNDTAFGGQGNDVLYGNPGNDVLYGNLGADIIYGNQGNDVLYGGMGNNVLYGGMDDDVLYGGTDDDILVGGLGNNILVGDVGADRYVFAANPGARDVVLGFDQGEGDRLSLGGQTYTTSTAQNGDALLTLSGGGTIDLAGIKAEQVNASFFAA